MTFLSRLTFALVLSAALSTAHCAEAPFHRNVEMRGDLQNSRAALAKKAATVAFLGGSITEMEGYRPMVMELLRKRFPDQPEGNAQGIRFINAGIASTCSTTGAFRLATDVFKDGPVDLLFVEFAVNDDQDAAHTRTECIRGLEGVVRHARELNPRIDIVVTYFVNESMLATLQAGKTPLSIEAHQAVAEHYQLPVIHLAREVAQEITAGELTWKQYGGVHPAPYGNAIAARMIDALLEQAWNSAVSPQGQPQPHPLPVPLDPFCYQAGHFISPDAAKVVGGWTWGVPDWKALPGGKRPRFTSIPMLTASEPGSELRLDFTGSAIGAFVVAGPDAGVLEAVIDGGAPVTVNLFHHYSSGLHYPRTVLFGDALSAGPHTLLLRVAEATHSTGHAARIMQFTAN